MDIHWHVITKDAIVVKFWILSPWAMLMLRRQILKQAFGLHNWPQIGCQRHEIVNQKLLNTGLGVFNLLALDLLKGSFWTNSNSFFFLFIVVYFWDALRQNNFLQQPHVEYMSSLSSCQWETLLWENVHQHFCFWMHHVEPHTHQRSAFLAHNSEAGADLSIVWGWVEITNEAGSRNSFTTR